MEQLRRRLITALLFALPLLFWPVTPEPFETPKLLLLITITLAIWGVYVRSGSLATSSAPLTWVAWAFIGSALLSTVFSMHWPSSLWGGPDSFAGLGLIAGTTTVFFAAQTMRGDSWRWAVIAATAVATGYGFAQILHLDPIEWTRTATWCESVRPFSALGHPNVLAGYLAMATPIALTFGVTTWRRNQRAHAVCVFAAVTAGSGLVMATLSRAGWIALAGGLLVATLGVARSGRWIRPRTLGVALILAVVALVAAAPTALTARAKTFFQAPTRRFIYESALRIFIDHPLVGSGVDTFQLAFQQHRPAGYWEHEWGATPQRAHNDFLHVLATQGALGGLVALVGIVLLAILARRALRSPDSETQLNAAGLAGCLVAAAVHATFGFHVAATATLAAVAVGQLVSLSIPDSTATVSGHALSRHFRGVRARIPACVRVTAGLTFVGVVGALLVAMPLLSALATRRAERIEANDSTMAIEAYMAATQWMPFSDTAWAQLAVAQQRDALRGAGGPASFRSAEDSFRRAAALSPRNAYHQANLGRFLGRIEPSAGLDEKRAMSAKAYDLALRLDPNNALLALDAIETAVAVGDLSHARHLAERLLANYPNLGAAWSWLGFIAQSEGKTEEARAFLQNAIVANWHGDTAGRLTAFDRLETALRADGLIAEADETHVHGKAALVEPLAAPSGCRE